MEDIVRLWRTIGHPLKADEVEVSPSPFTSLCEGLIYRFSSPQWGEGEGYGKEQRYSEGVSGDVFP